VIVNSPSENDIDSFQCLKESIAKFTAMLILENIRKLSVGNESKERVFKMMLENLKNGNNNN
jgi:hypothetical protein